jgi:hypothetical protein
VTKNKLNYYYEETIKHLNERESGYKSREIESGKEGVCERKPYRERERDNYEALRNN